VVLWLGCSSGDFDAPSGREEVVHWSTSIETEDPRATARALRTFTGELGGYVSASEEGSDWVGLRLRVPSTELASLRVRLTDMDPELHLAEQAEDVTEAHGDLSARLRNQRATEVRLLTLLEARTATLADVLAAERELARVREQIETLETERALVHRVAFADVDLTVRQRSPSLAEAPLAAFVSAFSAGATAALQIVLGTTVVLSAMLPSLTLLAGLGLVTRMLYRRVWRREL